MSGRSHARAGARLMVATMMAALGTLLYATAAHAGLSTPANGAVVRGNGIQITETSGGQDNCSFGNSGDDTRILIDGVVRFAKGDGGPYTVFWNTINAYPNGNHTITSQGRNITNGFFSCNTGGYYNIHTITVNVQNRSFLAYTGVTSQFWTEGFTASARISLEGGAGNVGGRTVTFCASWGPCASAGTNGSGDAAVTLPASPTPGSYSVTASYGGDAFFTGSSAGTGFTILRRPTVLTYNGATSVYSQETLPVGARLLDVRNGSAIGGKPIGFIIVSTGRGASATTDGGGQASSSILADLNAGGYSLFSGFDGDPFYVGSWDVDALSILGRPTQLVYTGDTSGYWNETATLSATLTDVRAGSGLGGKPVSFNLGSFAQTATTAGDGTVSISVPLGQTPGNFNVVSTFAGDGVFVASGDTDPFEILKRPTSLAYTGDTSGYWNENGTFSAVLTDVRNADGLEGFPVRFTMGTFTATGTTDADGVATVTGLLDQTPATFNVVVEYDGDANYVASNTQSQLEILKRPTTLVYDGDVSGDRGHTVTLSATLTDTRAGGGLGGKTVHFELGSASGDDDTDGDGAASIDVLLEQEPGPYDATAAFAGDAYYVASNTLADFALEWEYTFIDETGAGTVYLNTSTKEFRLAGPAEQTTIKHDPGMNVIYLPKDVVPPPPPCDPNDPGSCTGPTPTPPPPPCDPNDPESCLPAPPCDPNDPESCLPPVPDCVDDPTGGDPICPGDYIPTPEPADAVEPTPTPPPVPCDPNDPATCVPATPEPTATPEPPCDGVPDPQECIPPLPVTPCTIPLTANCEERFVTIVFTDEEVTLVGFFDLETATFASTGKTADNLYVLRRILGEPPPPPCDPNDPASCTGPTPTPPPPPSCDPNDPASCVPPVPTPEPLPSPTPPPPPCDPNKPTTCIPA